MDTSFDLRLPAAKHNRFEIVVAHYNEDLSWLKPAVAEAIIYVKGTILDHMRLQGTGIDATDGNFFRKSTERGKAVSGNDQAP